MDHRLSGLILVAALLAPTLHCSDSSHTLADTKRDAGGNGAGGAPPSDPPSAIGGVASESGGGKGGGGENLGGGVGGPSGGVVGSGGATVTATGGSGGLPSGDAGVLCSSPRPGCCFVDQDCKTGLECADVVTCTVQTETPGFCKSTAELAPGQCWRDADCPASSGGCNAPQICGCGHYCVGGDVPGICQS
jgi:hypothetical protein